MSPISAVSNSDLEIDHMIGRVTLPATSRLPERSSGDRAPQTPERSRRQKGTPNLPQRRPDAREDEQFDEELPPHEPPPSDETLLYSPSRKGGTSYSKDGVQHNVDIRA